jgi:hypothetical protein
VKCAAASGRRGRRALRGYRAVANPPEDSAVLLVGRVGGRGGRGWDSCMALPDRMGPGGPEEMASRTGPRSEHGHACRPGMSQGGERPHPNSAKLGLRRLATVADGACPPECPHSSSKSNGAARSSRDDQWQGGVGGIGRNHPDRAGWGLEGCISGCDEERVASSNE